MGLDKINDEYIQELKDYREEHKDDREQRIQLKNGRPTGTFRPRALSSPSTRQVKSARGSTPLCKRPVRLRSQAMERNPSITINLTADGPSPSGKQRRIEGKEGLKKLLHEHFNDNIENTMCNRYD
ncbi:hypothetical protein Sste5346_008522 [Sporothrix stenoceras]|uniref:Uncharacterized protein n=1 Tax=Sporothrix stenoceras TaxID=5173 RepID=A0ABR3YQG1_9PEZI